jgi:hypothetical protein
VKPAKKRKSRRNIFGGRCREICCCGQSSEVAQKNEHTGGWRRKGLSLTAEKVLQLQGVDAGVNLIEVVGSRVASIRSKSAAE